MTGRHAARTTMLLAFLLAAPLGGLWAGDASAVTYTVRTPIVIASNADFTSANGVGAGSGTAGDPYVISGWHVTGVATAALTIRDVTAAFVVRDNLLDSATQALTVVDLQRTGAAGAFVDNVVQHRGTGVSITGGTVNVTGNTVAGPEPFCCSARSVGVRLTATTSNLTSNHVVRNDDGVASASGGVRLRSNTFDLNGVGVSLASGVDDVLQGNTFRDSSEAAAKLSQTTRTLLSGNTVVGGSDGFVLTSSVANASANSFTFLAGRGIAASLSVLGSSGDTVSSGASHGLHAADSTVTVTGLAASNLLGTGILLERTEGTVASSTVSGSAGGIALSASRAALTGNVLTNNSFGLSIPYDSKQAVPLLSGNLVNGINVDGTIVPSQRRIFYNAWGFVVTGQTVDNGVSSAFSGVAIKEGGIVLYDPVDVSITGNVFRRQNAGVLSVGGANVQVRANSFIDNVCAVVFIDTDGDVKNNSVNLTIDPVATCGVNTTRGHVIIRGNTIFTVTTGIDVRASTGVVDLNFVQDTHVGIRVTGFSGQVAVDTRVDNNTLEVNRIGILAVAFHGTIRSNDVWASSDVGIRLENGSQTVVEANAVAMGRLGIGSSSCGAVAALCVDATLEANVVTGNEEGMNASGTFHLEANAFVGNEGNGVVVAGMLFLSGDVATGNGEDGFRVFGSLDARGANATANVEAGFRLNGTFFLIAEANVSGNGDGIIAITPLPPPPTVTITPPPPPTGIPPPLSRPPGTNQDPLIVHDSIIEANERWAVFAEAAVLTDARFNFWGDADGPGIHANPLGRPRGNVVSPNVVFVPWFADRAMTQTMPPGF